MPRCISRFAELLGVLGLLQLCHVSAVRAQACCSGASAVTPGRLAMHENALVGAQLRGSLVLGSYDGSGEYARSPAHTSDLEFEQDLFGAVRFLERAQFALLVPFIEARRSDRSGAEFGGGLGDVAPSLRYDFTLAGRADNIPGIAVLLGATLPTGRPPERANRLGTDATGLGVVQGSAGVSVEQTFDRWFVNLIGLVALRAERNVSGIGETSLAPQWSAILGGAYTFPQGASLALSIQYNGEGNATIAGMTQPMTGRRRTLLTVAGLYPLSDTWQLRGFLIWDPPIDSLGKNQLSNTGLGVTIVHAWL